jgi:Family of unknown function (DUF5752)
MEDLKPFEFKQYVSILKATGLKAKTLPELRDALAVVSEGSIFHHTYQYFLKVRALEYSNDFAHWAGESLEERSLAEHLSNIDPYDYGNIEDLRNKLITVIDEYLNSFPVPREAMTGDEFYFNETITLIFPEGVRARNLAEFLMAIKYIDARSVYYHFYEARVRLGVGTDDFSAWFENVLGKKELAARIMKIDPFMHSLEGIREHIALLVEKELGEDMAVILQ